MYRSFDKSLLEEISEHYPDLFPATLVDCWYDAPKNLMFADGRSVSLFTYEYPGAYTGHWFFTDEHRGRKALTLARKMLDEFFIVSGAKLIRGIVKKENAASRWAARQIGMTSHGMLDFVNGPHELFTLTKDEFYEQEGTLKWAA